MYSETVYKYTVLVYDWFMSKKAKKQEKKQIKTEVKISNPAKKEIAKLTQELRDSFQVWVVSVTELGLAEGSKPAGYNLEKLSGNRKGQRSVRLSKGYRVIFTYSKGEIHIVTVLDVNNHKY